MFNWTCLRFNDCNNQPLFLLSDEFNRKEAVYLERVSELEEITQKRDRARKRHDDLRKTRLNEFMEGFGIITAKLKEMYQVCCCWQSIFFVFARFCSGMLKLSNYAYIRVEQWAENIYTDSTTFYFYDFFREMLSQIGDALILLISSIFY